MHGIIFFIIIYTLGSSGLSWVSLVVRLDLQRKSKLKSINFSVLFIVFQPVTVSATLTFHYSWEITTDEY